MQPRKQTNEQCKYKSCGLLFSYILHLHVGFFGVEIKTHSSSVPGDEGLPFLLFLSSHSGGRPFQLHNV